MAFTIGLPARRMINRRFLPLMMNHGLDGALLDPFDRDLGAALATARMLLGDDGHCLEFMDRCTAGKIPAWG